MATNEILPFAPNARESQGDILSQADYQNDIQRLNGQSGLARKALNNKALRQATHIAAGAAQFIANRYKDGVKDDGDLGKVEAGLVAAVQAEAINATKGDLSAHVDNKNNPHGTSAEQVGAAPKEHKHTKNQITDFPTSLPANGGNADTVGGKRPEDFAAAGAAPTAHKHTKDQITDFPTSLPANGGNADAVGGKRADDFVTAKEWNSSQTETTSYIDARCFSSRKPVIGYFDDDTTANIFGAFEISKSTNVSAHVMSDNRAVENLWYFARDGSIGSVNKLFRAQRLNDTAGWQYSNELIQPSYVPEGQYINYIFGMGSTWMIQRFNINSSTTGHYLIDTKGSSRPEDWSIIQNVSPLISGYSLMGCLYFPEYGTILTVDIASGVIYYRLTRVSTMTDIIPRSKLIEPMVNLITDWSFFSSINKTPTNSSQLTAFYNPYDKQLIMSPFVSLTGYRADTGMKWESNLTIFLPFLVPDNFFRDGLSAGNLIFNMAPNIDYLSPPATSMPGFSGRSGWIPYSFVTYDERKRKIYVCETDTNNTSFYVRRLAYNNRPQTGKYLTADYENYSSIQTPDASPWAKGTNSFSYFFNDVCYFRGQSNRYGSNRNVCTEYDKTALGANSEIIKTPGKWWIGQQQTDDAGATMHDNATSAAWLK